MGHAIERIALERGHQIVSVIYADNTAEFDSDAFASADAAIEFTTPSTAPVNIVRSAERGVPVVCGSTGWADRRAEVEEAVLNAGSALIASSNFSIGVHVFNSISRRLARIMDKLEQYEPSMTETHHIHKLDHPSGTAITLAEGIIAESRYTGWQETDGATPDADPALLPVSHRREGEVPGTHIIRWDSPADTITLEHRAKNRSGFAMGAVYAAEWLAGAHGAPRRYSMTDVLESIFKK